MTQLFQGCEAQYTGLLHDAAQHVVIVNVGGFDVFSVTIQPTTGTIATAAIKVRYGHSVSGPFTDFSTAVTLNTATRSSGLLGVVGPYIVLDVTTGEGAACYLDVMVTARKSDIPTEVAL